MDWLITIIVGGIIGWLASLIMRTDLQQGLLWNIVIGVVGAILGRWIFGSIFNVGTAEQAGALSFWGIFWGIIGAVILIALLKAFRVLR